MTTRSCEVCRGVAFLRLFTKDDHEFYRCRSCRLIRIDPQPTDEVLSVIYDGKYFEAWGVPTGASRVMQLKKETFRRHVVGTAALPKGARVLDCGAAFGALMEVAAESGLEPYGIELVAEAAAAIARRFGPDRVFSGPFEQASFAGLRDEAFDGIFMCDFIEHVRDPLAVLRKASRLLKSGGCLVITTPDTDAPSCRLLRAGWPHYNVQHIHCFNRRNLALLLKRAGFTVTHCDWARKIVDLEYLCHNLAVSRPLVTPLVDLLTRWIGRRLRNWPLSFALGQMLVIGNRDRSILTPLNHFST
jgi:SAM-dependent methyltransferase